MSRTARLIISLLTGMILLVPLSVCAAVSTEEAERVCQNWLYRIAVETDGWANAPAPEINSILSIDVDGLHLGYYCEISPSGYVVIPSRRELPPVTAYSETANSLTAAENPVMEMIKGQLLPRVKSIDDSLGGNPFAPDPTWIRYLEPTNTFVERMDKTETVFLDTEPLTTTRWGQHYPWNLFCPVIDGYTTFLGCTATAMAQVMAYHKWPLSGTGDHAYTWNGDQSCGGDSPDQEVYADFSDIYDWSNIVDEEGDMTPQDLIAVAEFCYETAVSLDMDFGLCSSGASLARARSSLVSYFRYADTAQELMRFRYSTDNWYNLIKQNIDAGRPIIYYTVVHTLVCDGWREVDGIKQIHLNYGWEGSSNGWYSMDAIYTSANPFSERMIVNIQPDYDQPIALSQFNAYSGQNGVIVNWELLSADEHVSFQLYRNVAREKKLDPVYLPMDQMGTTFEVLDTDIQAGHYEYWLEAWQKDGTSMWFGPAIYDLIVDVPEKTSIRLGEAWPNPFNPKTSLRLSLDRPQHVEAAVYDVTGRRIRTLLAADLSEGERIVDWYGRDDAGRAVPSGAYFIRMIAGRVDEVRKVVLIR
jgi:Peptidase C10 family/FlgD Ig-like domain